MHGAIAQLASGALTAAATVEVASLTHGIDVMIGVSNDLLDVEALRRGRLRVNPAPTDIRQVLSACATSVRGVNVSLDVKPSVPRMLPLDALRLQQVCARRVVP